MRTSIVKLLAVVIAISLVASCSAPPTALPPTVTPLPAATATSVPSTATPVPDLGEAMRAQLLGMAEQGFRGAVLVAKDGEIILSEAYGLADREQGLANTIQTKFRLASVTKQFTAMGIMILEQQGKVDVQASVCDYIPDCPAEWQPVTLHHLLTHTSGLSVSLDASKTVAETASPVEHTVFLFRDDPLRSPPGMHVQYSSAGYVLLAYVIEQVSGQTYEAFLRENIFDPLGMASSGWLDNLDGLALRYDSNASLVPTHPANDMAVWSGGGGLFSTVEDLYRWDRALYTETLVPQTALDRMFSVQAEGQDFINFGYGWVISTSSGHQLYYHEGAGAGVRTIIKRYVDEDLVVIVLSNQGDVEASSVAASLVKTVLKP